jgi:hypothetical protein
MGITEVLTAPQSPWQNAFAERLIGSIRRECLDHVIVLGEKHLRRILRSYFEYYQESRTHLSLGKDAPSPGPCNCRRLEPSWRLRKLVACIIATNGVLRKGTLEPSCRPAPTRSLPRGNRGLLTATLARQPGRGNPEPEKRSNPRFPKPSRE